MPRRVVITGAGTINPLGKNLAQTWSALVQGKTAIQALDIPDTARLMAPIGAPVTGWVPEDHFLEGQLSYLDRATQFALVAAREAVDMAGLQAGDFGLRAGVILGTAAGGHGTWDTCYRAVYQEGRDRVHPFTVPKLMANAPVGQISIAYGIKGPSLTLSTACASANHAIGLGYQMIQSGLLDVVLVGGAEAMLNFGGLKAWEGLRVMSKTGCRPFCQSRDGMVMGEGAAVLVLERDTRAKSRGARIIAELAGFSMGSDAHDLVRPSAEGAVHAMTAAMSDAGLSPRDIQYVNAHGTGTALNDATEAQALNQVFGANMPLVSSTKALHGHCIGAAGAIESLAVLMAIDQSIVPPNAGFKTPDPRMAPIHLVGGAAQTVGVSAALSNSFAFGGLNAVLAFRSVA